MIKILKIFLAGFTIPAFILAQGESVKLSRMGVDQVEVVGFTLENDGIVKINGVCAGGDKEYKKVHKTDYQIDPFNLYAYAWILDAHSREMVWRTTISNSSGDWWEKDNREFDENVRLPEGEYELYYAAMEPGSQRGNLSIGRIIDKLFEDDWQEHSRDLKISVSPVDAKLSKSAVRKYQRALKENALINLTRAGDGSYLSRGFSIDENINVEIYAIGEGHDGEMFDYPWLIDANTGRRIWQMKHSRSEHAGGAIKNRSVQKKLTLSPGDYILYYKSDDNHSSEEWNANPPYDPEFWGVTIFAKDKNFDRSAVKEYYEKKREPIVSITRLGDSEYEEEGLIVEKDGSFRVYALGEGSGNKMADYGWITNARNGARVWKMEYYKTNHAGGTSKNREIDEVISLKKGEYIVHFKTDGSHSYEEWNSTKPHKPEMWGITISPIGKEIIAKKTNVRNFKSENLLAELTRVGDDEHIRKQFVLDRETQIRINALGEGDWDEMYDYGWIENERTGRKVWRMRYRNTDHAGGAKKNREIDTIITLEPGTYTVHYISDDSHSYADWNASAPYKENKWGITIFRVVR
ncbi:MAG: hypothetical protein D8M58_12805 [Calditrichaeota bacterium]|nr:MAG: hypothetical protein DWQ03_13590 [Calditrichota bacterium]MBL1206278.1 hypothetical protein [Calditrichota bacterium]NOG46104.1 hypothetical protein [Calditrichota bacterium]